MKSGVGSHKLMKPCSYLFKIISIFLFVIVGATSSYNTKCPFQYVFHFGAAVTDIGNSMKIDPSIPAANFPYGITNPGKPTGRWSDGLIDFDYAAADFGLPNIVPYLALDPSKSHDGVIFSVARSPVLDREFFLARDITIEPFATPLSRQIYWFKKYIKNSCPEGRDCADRLGNSVVLFGDIEGNDIGYALLQGKSIQEVKTYSPYVIEALIDAARELIQMGATRLVIPGNGPLGCYPYILTALPSNNPRDYDRLGCLRSVNDVIMSRNFDLQRAIHKLSREFPKAFIFFGNIYDGAISIINDKSTVGPMNLALKACCGTGGKYNYNSDKFCGTRGVPYCSNPNDYVFWDGMFFTQDTYARMEHILVQPALAALNCTVPVDDVEN